jgi:hypothetical protein
LRVGPASSRTGPRSGRFVRICQSAMGFRVLVGDPISEGPRLDSDNSSHGEGDVRRLDVE